ncbi:phenylacetone monooxygenase [Plectosphaerella plurivora]|uniref:Phenylacetone monooxygenase n=1 Tax=Plectosphaerella plurivora TaxID=936078 RepID=A0A9P8VGX5_9PEZI|nr:phenylacetone monooxygenase [Plectosphaerella plurivora]
MGDTSFEGAPAVPDLQALSARYAQEKEKRIRADGASQYEELQFAASERFRHLATDPWVDHEALNAAKPNLADGDNVKVLIQGAGYGGLLFAIRFVQQGIRPEDIRLVDVAGGFGGTWWWNRFPGLTCDTQGYIYLPLLDETGYVPKHRFSGGQELLSYANLLADKWNLTEQGVFRSAVRGYEWDDEARRWVVKIEQSRGPGQESVNMTVKAQFVVVANGVLNHPKVPKNLSAFEGPTTHTARWDYGITGGTPDDPQMVNLKDKRVGIIGTGATGVQAIPELAKWAKELYVFQRTPSSIGTKGQRETDPEEWKAMTADKDWHKKRMETFDAVMAAEPGVEDTLQDGWTECKAYRGVVGGYHEKPIGMEDIPNHIGGLLYADAPRTERMRQRVDDIVKDKATAEGLKAWYPTWCKRPTFHDEYLSVFNQPHVHLVDTDGKGVTGATATGLLAAGKEWPLDVLILSTGFRSPAANLAEPGESSNMTIHGRGGLLMADKWTSKGPSTLHGLSTRDFPNLFLTGPLQMGASANFARVQDVIAEHAAYILRTALDKAGGNDSRVLIEATTEGEEFWAGVILERAMWLAGMGVCLPGYTNNEGDLGKDQAAQMKMARGSPYAQGMNAYKRVLEAWRAEGSMKYLEVSV